MAGQPVPLCTKETCKIKTRSWRERVSNRITYLTNLIARTDVIQVALETQPAMQ